MSKSGFFLVSRGLFEHPRLKPRGPFSDLLAMLWLIESAAHTARDVSVDCGSTRKTVHLERGQLTYSIRYLARAWTWSDKRVQRFLGALTLDQTLTTATTTGQTIITLCNYDKHQRGLDGVTTPTTTPTTTQATTNKKQLKQLERKNALQGFDDWYSIYLRKKSRKDAEKAFAKVVGSSLIALPALMEKTRVFAASWKDKPAAERKFIPYPASWLNAGGYHDEPDGGDGAEPAPVVRDPRSFTDADWQKRLTYLQDSETWLDAWGSKPGEPGCLVPSRLLIAPASKGVA
jgi:hypothetical protein